MTMLTVAKTFINLIYPARCAACKVGLGLYDALGICQRCMAKISLNPKPHCVSCGRSVWQADSICPDCAKRKPSFSYARSACLHEGVMKELIHSFKYAENISLAKALSRIMIDFIKEDRQMLSGIDIVTFVPMRRMRLMKRGFNQSRVLAHRIAEEFGLPLVDTLDKVRTTRPQNELSRQKRLFNLRRSMRAKDGVKLRGLRVLLIDDVMATGATLDESAKALLDAGAKEVRCLTLSRGYR